MKLLKNKKGASRFIEMLMITPFAIYIILFSLFKLVNFLNYNALNNETQRYTREIITCTSLSNALNSLAELNQGSDTQIARIEIINAYSNADTKVELNFGSAQTGSKFKQYIKQDGTFDLIQYNNNNFDYKFIEKSWQIGSIIAVYTFHDYAESTFGKLNDFAVVTVNGKKEKLSFGIETTLTAYSKQVISNQ